jgi:hypothetical protein
MAMCIIPAAEVALQALNNKETMADDLDEDFDPDAIEEDIDEEVDPDAIDPDAIDEDLVDDDLAPADDLVDDAEEAVVVDETDEAKAPEATPPARAKKRADDEEDDDEELDPDDVEADLDTILKDRIAAADEDEDEDELEEQPRTTAEAPDGVVPKRANEFMCMGCFLLVNRGQFGPENNLQCPVGESECPSIEVVRSQSAAPAKPKSARSTGRKR